MTDRRPDQHSPEYQRELQLAREQERARVQAQHLELDALDRAAVIRRGHALLR